MWREALIVTWQVSPFPTQWIWIEGSKIHGSRIAAPHGELSCGESVGQGSEARGATVCCPILPVFSLLGQRAPGCLVSGPPGATSLTSHTVLGGVAGWGPCGEKVAAVGEGTGAGVGGSGGGVGFCGLCSELPPRTPTSLGPDNSHSGTQALTPESPRCRPAAKLLREGRTHEELAAEDPLFLGTGLANVRGKGVGCMQKSQRKGAWVPDGPPHRPGMGA